MTLHKKLVAIVNKDLNSGVAMNALAHITIGLGASLGKEPLELDDYKDRDNNIYPNISKMPFIILRGSASEIKKLVKNLRENPEIQYGIFVNTMTGGTYQEQLINTEKTSEESLIYYGCVLFGPTEIVGMLTKKFSLWKDKTSTENSLIK